MVLPLEKSQNKYEIKDFICIFCSERTWQVKRVQDAKKQNYLDTVFSRKYGGKNTFQILCESLQLKLNCQSKCRSDNFPYNVYNVYNVFSIQCIVVLKSWGDSHEKYNKSGNQTSHGLEVYLV